MPIDRLNSQSLVVAAWAAGRAAFLPQLFPIPKPGCHFVPQPESELMREHAHLPAMVGFMRNHVAQHFHAGRPGLSPAISDKRIDPASTIAKRFSEHIRAASGALGQCRTGLLRRAVRAVELGWNLQVRRRQPDPFGANIVHVRKDRRDRPRVTGGFGWQFGVPGGRGKMFDQNLVHAIVGNKDPDGGLPEWTVDLVGDANSTRGHGSVLLDRPGVVSQKFDA
jgi:hypothetical protein